MTPPRVLLVEDDASISRFVTLALDEQPIELLHAASLAEARALLGAGPVRLLLCDLMLPDGSGEQLLQALAAAPPPRPRRVAFSAGLSVERRRQLAVLGVDEVLAKPVALADLLACVQRGLADTPAPAGAGAAAEVAVGAADRVLVDRYFGGRPDLFEAYRDSCRQQFVLDVQQGDRALARGDLAALRRLAHSLKTVLLTLGDNAASALAQRLEQQAESSQGAADWQALRAALLALPSR